MSPRLFLFILLAIGTSVAARGPTVRTPFTAAQVKFETLSLGASIGQFERRYAATLCDRDRLAAGMVWFHAPKPCRNAQALPENTIFALYTDAEGNLEGFVWFGDWLKTAGAFPVPVGATIKVAEEKLGKAAPVVDFVPFDDHGEQIELWRHGGGVWSITASGKTIGFLVGTVPDRERRNTVTNARRYLSNATGDADFVASANALCRIQTGVNSDASLRTEEDRMMVVVAGITASPLSPNFQKFMWSIAGVGRGSRYALIEAEVRKHGDPGWSCPGMALEDSGGR
jgi:hypothetical protein